MASESRQLITVLGASGLLGSAITAELADRPVRLRLVGRREIAVPRNRQAEVEIRSVDLTVAGAIADAVDGADVVIHLVAHMAGPGSWRVSAADSLAERVNVGLVQDLVDAVRKQRRTIAPTVLFAGSMSQVGRSSLARIDGTEPDEPLTAYDQQKMMAEETLQSAMAEGLLIGSTLRLATLYSQGAAGTRLDRGVVAAMTRRAFAGAPLTMWHDGSVKRDLLCVDDAARAFVAAMDHAGEVRGGGWLVGTGQPTSIATLFTMIADLVSSWTGQPPVSVTSTPPAAYSMPTDLLDFVLDPTRFERASSWSARVPLRAGLEGMVAGIAQESGGTVQGSGGVDQTRNTSLATVADQL